MKTRFPREFYIPKSYQKRESPYEGSTAVAYVNMEPPLAMGFVAERAKPQFHYRYATVEQMEKRVAEFFDSAKASEAAKAELKAKRKAERALPHPLKVGDILYSSWGYDQTNIDFYQVTRVVGPHTVELTKIRGKAAPHPKGYAPDTGHTVADPDNFVGEPFTKRADHRGYINLTSYSGAYPWDGKAKYWSAYA